MRMVLAIVALATMLVGCTDGGGEISQRQSNKLQASMLENINLLRTSAGLAPVVGDEALVTAGMRHARDMAKQGRPWNWGSDGSSAVQRAYDAGYSGVFLSELISETFEDEGETLAAWYSNPNQREALMDARAMRIGLGLYREANGKNWWALEIGG